jgi:hypothetical protein
MYRFSVPRDMGTLAVNIPERATEFTQDLSAESILTTLV